jgi:hypothetical protein
VEYLKGAPFRWTTPLFANSILGWRGLPGTNTLAYYEDLKVMDVKSFMTLRPDFAYSIYNIFLDRFYKIVVDL